MNKYFWGIIIVLIIIILIAATSGKKTEPPEDSTSGSVSSGMPVLGNEGEGVDEMVVHSDDNMMEGGEGMMDGAGMMSKSVTVTFNGDAFSPRTVTIKKGESVKFVNTTSQTFSVASNPHPQHTTYSEFDQWKTDQRGLKEFTFTFDRIGTWNYHNHLVPDLTGIVIVE